MIWDVVNACPHWLIRTRIGAVGEDNSHDTEPLALSFSPDSKTIWCTTWTCELQIWSVETGERMEDIPLKFSVTNRNLAADSARIGIVGPWLTGVACPYRFAVTPKSDKSRPGILVSCLCGIYPGVSTPVTPSARSDAFYVERPTPEFGIISLALSHNADSLAEISEDGYITVWDLLPSVHIRARTKINLTAWQVVREQRGSPGCRNRPRIVFSPGDDRVAIFSSCSARIKIWDFASNIDLCDVGDGPLTFRSTEWTENQQPHCVSPDWARCVTRLSRGTDHSFHLFHMEKNITFVLSGQIQRVEASRSGFHGHVRHGVSFSADSQWVAVAIFEMGLLQVWDTNNGEERIKIKIGNNDDRVFFWPDSEKVATSSTSDKIICIWDLENGECVRTFEGHTGNYTVDDIDL